MAMFATRKDDPAPRPEPRVEPVVEPQTPATRTSHVAGRVMENGTENGTSGKTTAKGSDSIVAAGLAIEGNIEGRGNVRIAGRFKGNVNVKGELTIEPGASINGEVRADTVFVGGEVHGHIISTSLTEFKASGTLIGDLKAGSLTVAAGSKMRGKVEFGWKEGEIGPEAGTDMLDEPRS
jgi:cytoskeletal protein CcmA (bactofilin family)